jgi:hypothetical protein
MENENHDWRDKRGYGGTKRGKKVSKKGISGSERGEGELRKEFAAVREEMRGREEK